MAINIIKEFLRLSKIESVLGKAEDATQSLPQGYSDGFTCEGATYYFAIAYHTDFIQMGVCIKFSAHAWGEYRKQYESLYGQAIQIHNFIANIEDTDLYTSRLSRIDIAIDFINEKVSVNTIYNQLSKKNQIVRTAAGRKNSSTLSGITQNNITSTFYLGTRGRNIKALLRVYDKKREQLETMGIHYEEALQYDDWVRFEAVYKGTYAHDLTDALRIINNDTELKNLLVSALTDRYQFYYAKSDRLTTFSKKMLDLLNQKNFMFSSPSHRTNSLEQSQKHILNGSGLFPYLYKVHRIWGNKGLQDCLTFLYEEYENYEPNDDVLLWLKKFSAIYMQQG